MACGDAYRHLVVTKSGYTPENPHGLFYVPGDYAEWHSLAEKLSGQVSKHMAALQRTEAETGEGTPEFVRLSPEWSGLLRAYEALPSVWMGAGKDVSKAIDVCTRAACMLEQVDAAIGEYGEKPPEIPTPGREPAPKPVTPGGSMMAGFGTILVVGGIGLAAYLWLRGGFGGGD